MTIPTLTTILGGRGPAAPSAVAGAEPPGGAGQTGFAGLVQMLLGQQQGADPSGAPGDQTAAATAEDAAPGPQALATGVPGVSEAGAQEGLAGAVTDSQDDAKAEDASARETPDSSGQAQPAVAAAFVVPVLDRRTTGGAGESALTAAPTASATAAPRTGEAGPTGAGPTAGPTGANVVDVPPPAPAAETAPGTAHRPVAAHPDAEPAAGPPPTTNTTVAGVAAVTTVHTADSAQGPGPVGAQVFPEVARLVTRGDGTQRLTLRLSPENLGEVRIVVTVRDGHVDVSLAAGAAAQEALRHGSPELRRLLESVGAAGTQVVVRDLPATTSSTPAGAQPFGTGTSTTYSEGGAPGRERGGADPQRHTPDGHRQGAPTHPTATTAPPASAAGVDLRL
jgi:flagellar hook-length control protein FliK